MLLSIAVATLFGNFFLYSRSLVPQPSVDGDTRQLRQASDRASPTGWDQRERTFTIYGTDRIRDVHLRVRICFGRTHPSMEPIIYRHHIRAPFKPIFILHFRPCWRIADRAKSR